VGGRKGIFGKSGEDGMDNSSDLLIFAAGALEVVLLPANLL
jgi:hypothetical protein